MNELSEDWFEQGVVPRFEFGFDFVAAAMGRRRQQAPVGAEEVEVEPLQRRLRQVFERDHHAAGLRIQLDRAGQLDVGPESVSGDEDPVLVAGLGFTDVDRPRQFGRQGGAVDLDRADLRDLRAFRFQGRAEVGLGVAAEGLAVRGVRVDREALGEGDDGALELGRRGDFFAQGLRRAQIDVEAGRSVGLGGRGLRGQRRVERQLLATRRRRPGRFGVCRFPVVGEDVDRGGQRDAAGGRVLEEGNRRRIGGTGSEPLQGASRFRQVGAEVAGFLTPAEREPQGVVGFRGRRAPELDVDRSRPAAGAGNRWRRCRGRSRCRSGPRFR